MNFHILKANLRRTLPEGEIAETVLPLCPGLKLYLIKPHNVQRAFSGEETTSILKTPPYWSFCWSSGHALARFLLEHRDTVEGKRVLDFGTGSGVSAIASALAGAGKVAACDLDRDALDAARANAALNRVRLEIVESPERLSGEIDLIVASDILYDQENLPTLKDLLALAPDVMVAESRVKTLALPPYQKIGEVEAPTIPDLDPRDPYRHVTIYRADPGAVP